MALAPFHFALSGAAGRVGGALPPYRDPAEAKRSVDHFASYNFVPQQQGGSLTFTPADDAYIASASPSSNYGSATTLQVDNSPIKHFLLKFDVTGIGSQTITNAKIRLYNVDAASEDRNL